MLYNTNRMLYNTNTSGNIIKDNDEIQWTNETHFFIKKYISHFILEKGPQFVVSWEIDGETYTQREDFFTYLLPGARGCQRLHPLQARQRRPNPLIGCVSLTRLRFSALCPNLTAWFSSRDLPPVTHLLNPTALIALSCFLITTWQLVKAHGVTRNEPKNPWHMLYNKKTLPVSLVL